MNKQNLQFMYAKKMNKLQSRHVSSKSYLLWILYDDCNVISWYCKCRTGSRVVGMCAHVASVIWYLAYARNLDQPFCCQRLDRILKRCQKHARAWTSWWKWWWWTRVYWRIDYIHFTFIFVSAKDRVGFCSIFQLFHDENKLTFNEMIMRSALY